jgi:uncharacterized membrane protein
LIAFSDDVYNWIKLVHILAAIVWVGGGIFIQIYVTRLMSAGEMTRLGLFAKDLEKIGNIVFIPASITVLIMGIVMVAYAPFIEVTDLWIILGLAGIVSTILFGSLFLGPEAGRLGTMIEERGYDDPELQSRMRRLFLVSRVDLSVIVFVVVMMVLKPGS